jgi:hypothetical protein
MRDVCGSVAYRVAGGVLQMFSILYPGLMLKKFAYGVDVHE